MLHRRALLWPDSDEMLHRMRRKYDLREQLVGLSRRNAAAKEAAQGFADAMSAGQLDPKGPDFNQSQGPSAEPAVL